MTDEESIGDYRIIRQLGSGGMGEVYLAQHPRLPRRDAVKLLDRAVSRDDQYRQRFNREAELLSGLRHPNIITVYDRGEQDGRLWLAMEYIAGQDCADILRARGPMPLRLVIEIVAGAGAALDYAYSRSGITHRDVKPANILTEFAVDGRLETVKLADFGIAKAADESAALTGTGVAIGTMAYISPEAVSGDPTDNRSDIYSLAITAFQLLTGATPFTAPTVPALMMAHLQQQPPVITERNPGLPAHLDAVFARALAKNPDERYQSCGDFTAALSGSTLPETGQYPGSWAAVTRPNSAQPAAKVRSPARGKRLAVSLSTVAATVLLIAGGLFWYARTGNEQPSATAEHSTVPVLAPAAAPADPTGPVQTVLPFTGVGSTVIGLASDSIGTVYLADHSNRRVLELPAGATSPTTLPLTGIGEPAGLAIDTAGNVYIADTDNHRVIKWLRATRTEQTIPLPDGFAPCALAVDAAGSIYVTDATSKQVSKLTPESNVPVELPFPSMADPVAVAVDASGSVYVADRKNDRILELNPGSDAAQTLPFGGLTAPFGLTISPTNTLYVSSMGGVRKLIKWSKEPQTVKFADGVLAAEAIATDTQGNVYTFNGTGNRVLKLAPRLLTLPFDNVDFPMSIDVDNAGNVFAIEYQRGELVKLAVGANHSSVALSGLNKPSGVAVDAAGNAYIADQLNARVLKLPPGSTAPETLPFTGLRNVRGIAVDRAGAVYVADGNESHNVVQRLDPGATSATTLPLVDVNEPSSVAVDRFGNVYVNDFTGRRILKLPAGGGGQETLSFPTLVAVTGIAVDDAGNLYVADSRGGNPNERRGNTVWMLAYGSVSPQQVAFGDALPRALAIDKTGNLYGADTPHKRVVKLTLP